MNLLAERFTEEDREQRPFAVEVGYEKWGDAANHILTRSGVALGVEPLSRAREVINENRLNAGLVLAMDVCRVTCEVGYESRDQAQEITMPNPSVLATGAAGDRYKRFYEDLLPGCKSEKEADESDRANFEANLRLASLVPIVAEGAYIWGRHGEVFEWPESSPEVVRSNNLTTVRPHAAGWEQRSWESIDDIQESFTNFRPRQTSRLERLRGRLSEKAWEETQVKQGMAEKKLLELIDDATQFVLLEES